MKPIYVFPFGWHDVPEYVLAVGGPFDGRVLRWGNSMIMEVVGATGCYELEFTGATASWDKEWPWTGGLC